MFEPFDALTTGSNISGGFQGKDTVCFRKASARGVTLQIYGSIGTSDLTGKPTVEELEVWCGDGDITNGLPESFLQDLVESILEDAA
jgi:hypothetical protein